MSRRSRVVLAGGVVAGLLLLGECRVASLAGVAPATPSNGSNVQVRR